MGALLSVLWEQADTMVGGEGAVLIVDDMTPPKKGDKYYVTSHDESTPLVAPTEKLHVIASTDGEVTVGNETKAD